MQNQNADDDVDGNNKKIFHFVLLISLENAHTSFRNENVRKKLKAFAIIIL